MIVRYDYDARRWVHSAGIVISAREAVLLEALARGLTTAEMSRATGMERGTYYNAQTRLKYYFGIPVKTQEGQNQLLKIATDLYGGHPIAQTPRSEPRDATCKANYREITR
jgi:hypothetical protein